MARYAASVGVEQQGRYKMPLFIVTLSNSLDRTQRKWMVEAEDREEAIEAYYDSPQWTPTLLALKAEEWKPS